MSIGQGAAKSAALFLQSTVVGRVCMAVVVDILPAIMSALLARQRLHAYAAML